jgi:hypothetical protein
MMLWESEDCAAWHAAGERYPGVVQAMAQTASGLAELDEWYHTALPRLLAGRDPAFLTRDELVSVTRWKMKRGVWRERNLVLVKGNDEAAVREGSAAAFAAVPDPRRPVALLSRFAGVGPATASAVLAAYAPAHYPFFDEVVAGQAPGLGPVAFTLPYYLRYAAALRDRAQRLAAACPHQEWTAQAVSQALWAVAGGKLSAQKQGSTD